MISPVSSCIEINDFHFLEMEDGLIFPGGVGLKILAVWAKKY
jgi:hypothetical protein